MKNCTNPHSEIYAICILTFVFSTVIIYLQGKEREVNKMATLKVYKCYDENNNENLTLEVWSSSTKYPDAKFYFSDFNLSELVSKEHQVFQWLLECASKMRFPSTAKEIAELAFENYITWEN